MNGKNGIQIVELKQSDRAEVLGLLATGDLITEDILAEGTRYWGAYSERELQASSVASIRADTR